MVIGENVCDVIRARETRRPDPATLSVTLREVHQIRLLAEKAFEGAQIFERDPHRILVKTPSGHHAFEVVRLGWGRTIVHGDLAPVTFRGERGPVENVVAWLAGATLDYVHGKAEGPHEVYSAEAFAEYLQELIEEGDRRQAELGTLLRLVRQGESAEEALRAAHEIGLEVARAHLVYDASLVWAHEALKVAFRLITEARWAAFNCDPCTERLALYNASAAVCRTIRRNEREGW